MFHLPAAGIYRVCILGFLSMLGVAGVAQTKDTSSLITLVQPVGARTLPSMRADGSAVSLLPQTISLPPTERGTTGSTQTIHLRLNANLSIKSINVPDSTTGEQEFRVTQVTGCNADGGATYFAGTVCSVGIQFTPSYPGLRAVPLRIETSEGVVSFGVTGIGVAPLAAMTPGIVSTFAGTDSTDFIPVPTGDGGPAANAVLGSVSSIAIDHAGNIYLVVGMFSSDFSITYSEIRKIDGKTGIITTIAGIQPSVSQLLSGDDGPAAQATFGSPSSITFDSADNLYLGDQGNDASGNGVIEIRKIDVDSGIISKIAKCPSQPGYSGDGGPFADAGMDGPPRDMAFDSKGNLYLAFAAGASQDLHIPGILPPDYRVRKVDAATGVITTIAGTGIPSQGGITGDGGAATATTIYPTHIVIDGKDNLYISEFYTVSGGKVFSDVRKVDATTGIISTFAGTGTNGNSGDGGPATSANITAGFIQIDPAGNLYISGSLVVRKVDATSGIISRIAGTGQPGYTGDGGSALAATFGGSFGSVGGLALDSNADIYISDTGNSRIRRIAVSNSALTFPTAVAAGTPDTADNPQKAILSNVGNAPLQFGGNNPYLNSPDFALDNSTTCTSSTSTLAAGDSCLLAVNLTPSMKGSLTSTLTLTDNSGNVDGSQQTVQLSGTGLEGTVQPTATVLTSINPPTAMIGQTITLTATVVDTKDATKMPMGTVTFFSGQNALGTASLVNGIASFNYVPTTATTFLVNASYKSDDPDQFGDSSTATGQTLTVYPDFAIVLASTNGVITASRNGAPAVFDVQVQPGIADAQGGTANMYPGKVTFSVSGLPSGATATFSPATLPQDAGSQTVQITLNLRNSQAMNKPAPLSPLPMAPVSAACVLMVGGLVWPKRRRIVPILMVALFAGTTMLSGCMQHTTLQPSDVSTYTVVITATSGTAHHDVSVQLRLTQ